MDDNVTDPKTLNADFPIPPAGLDDNGEPFWIIEGGQVGWEEMEQYLWQYQQENKPAVQPVSSVGFEGIPQIPQAPSMPDFESSVEQRVEAPVETKFEKQEQEKKPEVESPQNQLPDSGAVTDEEWDFLGGEEEVLSPLFSKGIKTKVRTDDIDQVNEFISENEGGAQEESSTFLATLLKKILTMQVFRP